MSYRHMGSHKEFLLALPAQHCLWHPEKRILLIQILDSCNKEVKDFYVLNDPA